MKKLKHLAETLREFNGLIARMKKNPSEENKEMLDDCLRRLKLKVDEVLG